MLLSFYFFLEESDLMFQSFDHVLLKIAFALQSVSFKAQSSVVLVETLVFAFCVLKLILDSKELLF